MKSRKKTTKRSNAKPTAKQLAARKKFAAAAKARSRKRNASITSDEIAKLPTKQKIRIENILMSARLAKETINSVTLNADKSVSISITNDYGTHIFTIDRKGDSRNPARRKNKTVIVKPRKVTLIQVGKLVRRKVRNGYVDLVIRGQATKTPQGWKVGRKTIPQGKGTVSVSSGYYLDKASGTIFAKRARNTRKRNLDHRDSDHPIEVTKHWRQGPPGYLTPWQRAHHAGQKQLFDTGIKPAKKRNATKKASPAVKKLREKFSGQKSAKTAQVFAPAGTPSNVAKLGKLALIETETARIKPTGTVYLCADAKGKLHLCGATDAPLYSGPRQNFGQVLKVEYETAKPHLYPGQGTILFYHRMGEEGGKRPTLIGDGKGGLKFRGGSYKITREGIVG